MDELRSSRILVLDDDPKEALTVVRALQMMGLAPLYHDGGADNPAPAKLRGIRVLFLDMVLAAHGADANDHKGCAAMVVGALERLLEPNDDPLVVVCWTGHPEIKENFETQLRSSFSKNKIGTVFLAPKPAPQDLFSQDTFNQLTEIMTRGLSEHGALSLLFAWECKVLKAALLTGDRLTELITKFCAEGNNSTSWANAAFRICAAMALAARGQRLIRESDVDAVTAFHGALNPILNDRLDHNFPANASDAVSKELLNVVKAEAQQWNKNAAWSKEEKFRERLIKEVWKHFGSDLAAHFQANLPITHTRVVLSLAFSAEAP